MENITLDGTISIYTFKERSRLMGSSSISCVTGCTAGRAEV